MPGAQLSYRNFSLRARARQRKIQKGSQKMATTCWKDMLNQKLLPIKITFFLIMGATQCIAPYGTLLKKSLGLTVEETAIIYTIGPLIAIFAPFIAGLLADRIGNFRLLLIITVALSGIFALITVLIPPARTFAGEDEKDIKFDLSCEDYYVISYAVNLNCRTPNNAAILDTVNITNCGYKCTPNMVQIDTRYSDQLQNITIQSFLNDSVSFYCKIKSIDEQTCYLNYMNITEKDKENNNRRFTLSNVVIDYPKGKDIKAGEKLTIHLENYVMTPQDTNKFHCKSGTQSVNVSLPQFRIFDSNASSQDYNTFTQKSFCKFYCEGSLPFKSTCNITSLIREHDVSLSFGLFIFSLTINKFMIGITYTMFEAGVVAITKEYNYEYGIQRVYGSIGGMIFAPLTGYMIDSFGTGSYKDYHLGYYLYFGVKLLCAASLTKLDLKFKKPSKQICGTISDIFKNAECLLLIAIVFVSGTCYGFIENFLPWHVQNMGAPNWMIGLMTTVASVAALPFLAYSDPICRRFGHVQAISFGLLCYSIRCFGYSMIRNPFWCFPFETLEGVTTGLLVAAAIIYGAKLSNQSNVGTLQGILATSHYGLGRSIGSLLGGFMMAHLSARVAFRIFSGFTLALAFIYYLIFKLILFPRKEKLKAEIKEIQVEIIPSDILMQSLPIDSHQDIIDDDGYNNSNASRPR